MSYTINHQPISKLTRGRLLKLLEKTDREKFDALIQVSEMTFNGQRLEMQRAEVAAELESMTLHRDQYQDQADDPFRKLTSAETELSMSQARVAERDATITAMREDVTVLRRHYLIARIVALVCAAVAIVAGASWPP